jgi:hypothetical protein
MLSLGSFQESSLGMSVTPSFNIAGVDSYDQEGRYGNSSRRHIGRSNQ